jgi:YD repeat-containing protein
VELVSSTPVKTYDYQYDSLNRLFESTRTASGAPVVTAYDLDGAGNRNEVAVDAVPETYGLDATVPPADTQMNQYTMAPGEAGPRQYDENGNLLRSGAALPALFEHDYLDRIVRASGVPQLDSAGGVPAGSAFSDAFATGLDSAWTHDPAATGGAGSAAWPWSAGGYLEHDSGDTAASSALPQTSSDGDFWWVYTRPSGATGNEVLDAFLRISGQNTDTVLAAEFLKLDINADGISLWSHDGQLAAASVASAEATPYLIHAHVFGQKVIIRRGQLGQPLETVLAIENAPMGETDRLLLESGGACLIDDVNIANGVTEYTYDALGRRIEKSNAAGATRYLYDGARVAEEWDVPEIGNPTLAASYVYGLYIDEVLTMRRGGVDYYPPPADRRPRRRNVVDPPQAFTTSSNSRTAPVRSSRPTTTAITASRSFTTPRAMKSPARHTPTPTYSPAARGTRSSATTTSATATSTPSTADSPAATPSASGATARTWGMGIPTPRATPGRCWIPLDSVAGIRPSRRGYWVSYETTGGSSPRAS